MAELEFTTENLPAQVRYECTSEQVLAAGAQIGMRVGEDTILKTVPAGKQWSVVGNIRVVEENAE